LTQDMAGGCRQGREFVVKNPDGEEVEEVERERG
jgi:hypothetical protein